MNKKIGILFIINDFNIGGAEVFVLRLGKSLSEKYSIFVLDLYPNKTNLAIKKMYLDSGFNIIDRQPEIPIYIDKILWKLNALGEIFYKRGLYSYLKKSIQKQILFRCIKQNNIKIIHSHFYSSDHFSVDYLKLKNIKRVITLHGDYNEMVYSNMSVDYKKVFFENSKNIFQKSNAITYVADKNIEILNQLKIKPLNIKKVYLGYDIEQTRGLSKLQLKVGNDDIFTFCMVARAEESKGWSELLKAFNLLNHKFKNIRLLCVGPLDGIIKTLQQQYINNKNIIFTGFSDNPSDYILQSDICLLPSYYAGESLPYSIIEYLAYDKPIIATENGEIRHMLSVTTTDIAGILIPLCKEEELIKHLYVSMEKFLTDKELFNEKQKLTKEAFKKFSMKACSQVYNKIYSSVLN
jgi:glycosyltransferase involved in cell wall biosynthesis